jgi:hypothetical protein
MTLPKHPLRLWRAFIVERDGYQCVWCESNERLNAHHVFRRTLLPQAQFQTGNGITLCRSCHADVHSIWNGRPLPCEPLNCRGGDDIDTIADLFYALEQDGIERGTSEERFYYLSDNVLDGFQAWQGIEPVGRLQRARISEAHRIWQQAHQNFYERVGAASLKALLLPGSDDWLPVFMEAMEKKESVN